MNYISPPDLANISNIPQTTQGKKGTEEVIGGLKTHVANDSMIREVVCYWLAKRSSHEDGNLVIRTELCVLTGELYLGSIVYTHILQSWLYHGL